VEKREGEKGRAGEKGGREGGRKGGREGLGPTQAGDAAGAGEARHEGTPEDVANGPRGESPAQGGLTNVECEGEEGQSGTEKAHQSAHGEVGEAGDGAGGGRGEGGREGGREGRKGRC
jgi:hypothetical protein